MKKEKTVPVQVSLNPRVRSAGKIRAEQRQMTLSGHVGDLIKTDAELFRIWAIVNREEACGD